MNDSQKFVKALIVFYTKVAHQFWFRVDEHDIAEAARKQLELINKLGFNVMRKDRDNKEIFDSIVKRMNEEFPGIGDESGELDWETLVSKVIVYLNEESGK